MRRVACLAALLWLIATPALAIYAERLLDDPAREARAQELMRGLRCLVCQNQAISESNAGLARDLRKLVRERLAAGDSDEQALQYIVDRYGDWVLLAPPFKTKTLALWFGPVVLFLLGIAAVVAYQRRQRGVAPAGAPVAAPLTADEQARLRRLLDEQDKG